MRHGLPLSLLLAAVLGLPGMASGALKQSLALFFELGEQDSVTALVQKSATALEVRTVDMTTTEPGSRIEEVGQKPMAKLMAEARAEGVPVTEYTEAAPVVTEARPMDAPAAAAEGKVARSGRSQTKNRMWYMAYQVPLSTWVFGSSIPAAHQVDDVKVHVAMPLLLAPLSFGAHFWFTKSRPFEDSHFLGTRYLSLMALYAAYGLPWSFMDWDSDPFKTGVYVALAAYPAGLWAGYELGDRYIDRPGRIETQSKFATGFGTLGFFSPFLYFEKLDDRQEDIFRLALGQSIAFAAAGHFISEFYRSGENIPGGVTTGILTHAALGAGLGAEVAALSDASTLRPWLGAALAGGTLGFMEGLWYFSKRYDTNERGFYNALGSVAGMAMGGGMHILLSEDASDYATKVMVTSFLAGGALLGYVATDLLTRGMEDRPAAGPGHWSDRLALNPIPVPEPQVGPVTPGRRGQEVQLRYRVPGLTYTF